jgi:hypothetical protein
MHHSMLASAFKWEIESYMCQCQFATFTVRCCTMVWSIRYSAKVPWKCSVNYKNFDSPNSGCLRWKSKSVSQGTAWILWTGSSVIPYQAKIGFQRGRGSGHRAQAAWLVKIMEDRYVITVWALTGLDNWD